MIRLKKQIANLLTLCNLTLGLVSLFFSASIPVTRPDTDLFRITPYWIAGILILIAACLDRFDGKIARKTDSVSDLGKQLDSLSDLVSFGVAPALLTWKIHLGMNAAHLNLLTFFLYAAVLLFPLCGALRLAKFNIQEDPSYFVGIPITIAGAISAGINCIYLFIGYGHKHHLIGTSVILILTVLLAYLMLAPIKLRKR